MYRSQDVDDMQSYIAVVSNDASSILSNCIIGVTSCVTTISYLKSNEGKTDIIFISTVSKKGIMFRQQRFNLKKIKILLSLLYPIICTVAAIIQYL